MNFKSDEPLKAEELNALPDENGDITPGQLYNAGDYLSSDDFNMIINGIKYNLSEINHMRTDPVSPHHVLAGPERSSSPNGPPSFRKLNTGDLPPLNEFDNKPGNVLSVDKGGTGRNSIGANKILVGNGNNEFEERDIVENPFSDANGNKFMTARGVSNYVPRYGSTTKNAQKASKGDFSKASNIDSTQNKIEIPIARTETDGNGNITKAEQKTLLIQYGKVYVSGEEMHTRITLEAAYSGTDSYVTLASVGRSNSDKWGVDVVYVRNESNNQIQLIKDHYYTCFDVNLFWMTVGVVG